MYNLGIKDAKVQQSTLRTVKHLDEVKNQLASMLNFGENVDENARWSKYPEHSTSFLLQRNRMV